MDARFEELHFYDSSFPAEFSISFFASRKLSLRFYIFHFSGRFMDPPSDQSLFTKSSIYDEAKEAPADMAATYSNINNNPASLLASLPPRCLDTSVRALSNTVIELPKASTLTKAHSSVGPYSPGGKNSPMKNKVFRPVSRDSEIPNPGNVNSEGSSQERISQRPVSSQGDASSLIPEARLDGASGEVIPSLPTVRKPVVLPLPPASPFARRVSLSIFSPKYDAQKSTTSAGAASSGEKKKEVLAPRENELVSVSDPDATIQRVFSTSSRGPDSAGEKNYPPQVRPVSHSGENKWVSNDERLGDGNVDGNVMSAPSCSFSPRGFASSFGREDDLTSRGNSHAEMPAGTVVCTKPTIEVPTPHIFTTPDALTTTFTFGDRETPSRVSPTVIPGPMQRRFSLSTGGQPIISHVPQPGHSPDSPHKMTRRKSRRASVMLPDSTMITVSSSGYQRSHLHSASQSKFEEDHNRTGNSYRVDRNEWIQVPVLFDLFTYLIQYHELLEAAVVPNSDEEVKQIDDALKYLVSRIEYTIYEVKGILLSPLFTTWGDKSHRDRVKNVVDSWNGGENSEEFQKASMTLFTAISSNDASNIEFTKTYKLWRWMGSVKKRRIIECVLFVLTFLTVGTIFGSYAVRNSGVGIRIVFLASSIIFVMMMALLTLIIISHNAYADAASAFFREDARSVTPLEAYFAPSEHSQSGNSLDFEAENYPLMFPKPSSELRPIPSGNLLMNMITQSFEGSAMSDSGDICWDKEAKTFSNSATLRPQVRGGTQSSPSHQSANPLVADCDELAATVKPKVDQTNVKRLKRSESKRYLFSMSATNPGTKSTPSSRLVALVLTPSSLQPDSDETPPSEAIVASFEEFTRALRSLGFIVSQHSTIGLLDEQFHQGQNKDNILFIPDSIWDDSALRVSVCRWIQIEMRRVYFLRFQNPQSSLSQESSHMYPDPTALHEDSSFPAEPFLISLPLVDEAVLQHLPNQARRKRVTKKAMLHSYVPPYSLGRRLGGGAFATVFEAELEETHTRCAVKRIQLNATDEQLLSAVEEIELLSELHHPHIVRYMYTERVDSTLSIFTERCNDGPLTSFLTRHEPLTAVLVKRVLTEVLSAVAFLHVQLIIHRDLKPDNILFHDESVRLIDFGSAALRRDNFAQMEGTLAYMAPEVLLGKEYGKECDVWSVGCVAADILGVELPQRRMGFVELHQLFEGMTSHPEFHCSVEEVNSFLLKCLQYDPSRREECVNLLHDEILQPSSTAVEKWLQFKRGMQHAELERQKSTRLTKRLSSDSNMSLFSTMQT